MNNSQNKIKKTSAGFCRLLIQSFLLLSVSFIIVWNLPNSSGIWIVFAAAEALILYYYLAPQHAEKTADFLFRYRWAVCGAIFLLLTLLRLSGSSIGVYNEVLSMHDAAEESTLFGKARWIRSDEFGVQTMKYFSQSANGFHLLNPSLGVTSENMVLDYYSPVFRTAMFGKPMMWGYLLFGNDIGLSFYWNSTGLLLFMTAFEMLLILTQKDRLASLSGALLIWLSPGTQWWFMPHMPIVIMYAMALFDTGYYFFETKRKDIRIITGLLGAMAAVGFALSLFPAFQVPCAWTVLILLTVCLYRDRMGVGFHKKDLLSLAFFAGLALLILGISFLESRQELKLLLNTSYPGERMLTGRICGKGGLIPSISSLFTPFRDITYANNCETASYLHFAPVFLLLSPEILSILKKEHSADVIIEAVFIAVLVFMMIYMCIGVPKLIARITLFRYCNRIRLMYEWVGVLFSSWNIHIFCKYRDRFSGSKAITCILMYIALCLCLSDIDEIAYFNSLALRIGQAEVTKIWLYIGVAGMSAILWMILRGKKEVLYGIFLLVFFCGITVNPVERGTGAVYDHPLSTAISGIAGQEPDSVWLCTDTSFILPNYVAANGAHVINTTDFYPDQGKWEIIDPENKYREETNRYSNQFTSLTAGENRVELIAPDAIWYYINPKTVRKLSVDYLLMQNDDITVLTESGIACEKLMSSDGFTLYHLNYE